MPSALSWCHGGFRTALGALAACLLLAALPGSATAGYVESSLGRGALATEAIDAHRLLIYSLDADAELDLVTVRSTGDESKMELWFRLDLLPLFGGDVLFPALDEWVDNHPFLPRFYSGRGLQVLDVVAAYAPGVGVNGRRELFALVSASTPLADAVVSGSPPYTLLATFADGGELRAAVQLPDARRLHQFPRLPVNPGSPGFIAYPVAATTGDERVWLVRIGDDGSVNRLDEPLLHPGGAEDVLVLQEPFALRPALITLGAGLPLLWLRDSNGDFQSQMLVLDGFDTATRVVQGVVAEFQADGFPDLLLAFSDGSVVRWDGIAPTVPGQPMRFGPAQPVATGLTVHDMAELGVPYRDAMQISQRRAGIMIAAEPESRFYDTDPAIPGRPFQTAPARYAAALSVGAEFGQDIAFLGRLDRGVLTLEYVEPPASPPPAETPNPIGWADTSPLPYLYLADQSTAFLLDLQSDRVRARSDTLAIGAALGGGSCIAFFDGNSLFSAPANERDYVLKARGLALPTNSLQTFDICVASAGASGDTVIRGAGPDGIARRQAYRVAVDCRNGLASCLNAASPPAAPNKTQKLLIDTTGLATVRRFRDEILAATPKGRDYLAQYREFGPDAYLAVVATPYALRDIMLARDAWLPAISAWVDGDTSTMITAEMLDTLDLVAQHFAALGSERLAATIRDQYRRLDPRSLLGQTIGDLETRFEQTVPTRGILRSSFEAGEPGN